MGFSPWGRRESDMTEQLTLSSFSLGWGWRVQSNPSFSLVLGPFPIKGQSPSRMGMGLCGGCQSFPGAAALCLQSNTQERAGKSLDKIRNWSWPWR